MKVIHVSISPQGGAGQVAVSLNSSLRSFGVESEFRFLLESNLFHEPLKFPLQTVVAGIDEYIIKKPTVPVIISPLRSRLSSHALFEGLLNSEADIVHLHWVNGLLVPEQIKALVQAGKKVIWTLHDMSPFTGACHHSFSCDRYQSNCEDCPELRAGFKALAVQRLDKKYQLLKTGITYVAPSRWMQKRAEQSRVLAGKKLEVVPNPVDFEKVEVNDPGKNFAWIKNLSNVGLVIAANLADPNKQVERIVKVFENINAESPGKYNLLLVGNRGERFENKAKGIHFLGAQDKCSLKVLLEISHYFVTASEAESFSLTTAEAIVSDLFVYANSGGAASELTQGVARSLCFDTFEQLAVGLTNRKHAENLEKAPERFKRQFAALEVAKKYLKIYETALK